uniref:Uncharacterized protein LOC114342203 n=1 Tax=Diabrotica virgifera virgifera TaxID=50390 RepID=A0A6P7GGD1_DIAVI
LKERSVSPPPGATTTSQTQITNTGMPTMTSLPSPLQGSDSPIPGTTQPNSNILVNTTAGVGANVGQNNVYRPQGTQGMNMPPQKGVGVVNVPGGRMMANNQISMMQVNAPPGYHATVTTNSPINKINMPPQSNVQTSMPQNQIAIQTSMAQHAMPRSFRSQLQIDPINQSPPPLSFLLRKDVATRVFRSK